MRTKSFAEQILDSMVDEDGHCGERGLSPKQFAILSERLCEGAHRRRNDNREDDITVITAILKKSV